MAKTGSISISRTGYSIDNNTSDITVTGYITTSGDSWRGNQRTGVLAVTQGGTAIYSDSFTSGAAKNSTTMLFSISLTVSHNADGSSGRIEASYNYDDGWCTGSGSLDLPAIPRVSQPTLNASLFTITKADSNFMRIYTNRKSGFTHHVYYSFNGSAETGLASGVTDYYDWYFPHSLAEQMPNTGRASGYIRLYTFNGGTNIGNATVSFEMQLSNEFVPTVSITVADVNGYAGTFGKYIQGRSAVKVSAAASGVSGSTIRGYSTVVDGKTYSGQEITSDLITSGSAIAVTTTVTDSRGRTGSASVVIPVYPYTAPTISALTAKRCSADGTPSSSGSHLAVTFSSKVTALDNKNTATYKLEYHKKGDTAGEPVELTDYANTYEHTDTVYVIPADQTKSYEITLYIADGFAEKYGSTYKRAVGATVSKLWSWLHKGLGMAVGKIAELEGVFDIAFKTRFEGGILQPEIAAETDLDEVLTPNTYTGLEASTAGYSNCPITTGRFTLEVMGANPDETEGKSLTQRLTLCEKGKSRVYERHYYEGAWGDWMGIPITDLSGTRLVRGGYGAILRNDGNYLWTLVTNKDDPYGAFNALRPFCMSLANGSIELSKLSLGNVDSNSLMTDYVYARGTSGNWTYWKWCSGLAVCIHAPIQNGNFEGGTAWGNGGLYYGPDVNFSAYPFPFAEPPVCIPARANTDSAAFNGSQLILMTSAGTTTQPPQLGTSRGTQTTIGHPFFTLVAIGRWK